MSPRPKRTEGRSHDTVEAQIKAVARQQMAEHGTAGISLRGIARELSITAPAIYNYFPRLDDLITALIVDAFTALADAIEAAESAAVSEACGPKVIASCLAYREWAIAHPVDFQLIYGNPIPGYVAPAEVTVPLARQAVRRAVPPVPPRRIRPASWSSRPEYAPVPASITAHVATWLPAAGYDFPDALLCLLMSGWARIHGMVMLELFEHLGPVVGDPAAFYRHELEAFWRQLALSGGDKLGTQD